jgi:hypothetical protein
VYGCTVKTLSWTTNASYFRKSKKAPMKTKLLFAGLLLLSSICYCQSDFNIAGTWRITTLNAGIYHNYKNDSTAIPREMQASLKGSADSAFTINLITGMIKEFDNYLYIFQPNGQYYEKKGEKIKEQGTFIVDKKNQLVTLIVKNKSGGESRQNLHYSLHQQTLRFRIPSEDQEIVFDLEKVQ